MKHWIKHSVFIAVLATALFFISARIPIYLPTSPRAPWYQYPLSLPLRVGSYVSGSPHDFDMTAVFLTSALECLFVAAVLYLAVVSIVRRYARKQTKTA